jgi:hypothetical protein
MATINTTPIVDYDPQAQAFSVRLFRPTCAEAEIAALRAAGPKLASQIERLSANFPELATRARKAAFLILAGAVTLAEPGDIEPANGRFHRTAVVLARVKSETRDKEYLLTRGPLGVVICNCPDAQPAPGEEGAPRSRIALHTCQHVLASALST